MSETRSVPCGTCRLCCYGEAIILHPEDGDVAENYVTRKIMHPLKPGVFVDMLLRRIEPDGRLACIYLGEKGCTIWEMRPAICRSFDCRRAYLKMRDWPQEMKRQTSDAKVYERGRQLLRDEKSNG